MKKKTGMSVSIGSSTMLLIFVVISLVSFSVLSLSSAITDKKFTEKIKQKNLTYYEACNLAEEELCTIDTMLSQAYISCPDEAAYFAQVSEGTTIRIPVSDYQELQVIVTFLYPEKEGDSYYAIQSYSLVNTNTPDLDEGLMLLQ